MKPNPYKTSDSVPGMYNHRLTLSGELKTRLLEAMEEFSSLRVFIVGDLILDRFIWGEVTRISPEAPVPVVDVLDETRLLGGGANVAHNVSALGGRALVAGVLGEDAAGESLTLLFQETGLSTEGLVVESNRRTTAKTRIIAQNQQVARLDREDRNPIQPGSARKILGFIRENLSEAHCIVVSDYAKGVITPLFMNELRALAREFRVPVMVDPKIEHADLYRGATVITPNHHEASQMAHLPIKDHDTLVAAGRFLMEKIGCEYLLITRGKDGMTLFHGDGGIDHIPTVARRVFDVTGAGDTVIAALSLAMAAGLDPKESAILANAAAGIVVGEVGTSVATARQLVKAIQGA